MPAVVLRNEYDEICRKYIAGLSAYKIAEHYCVSNQTIYRILSRRNVLTRTVSESTRLNYPVREDAFDDADNNPEAAYWVGMLMADGSITKSKKWNTEYVSLALSESDAGHVKAFRDFLGSDRPLVLDANNKSRFPNCKPSIRFSVGSHRLVDALATYGVVPRKTYNAEVKKLETNLHFWRGMIDGDGSIGCLIKSSYTAATVSLCGTKRIVTQFSEFAKTVVPQAKCTVTPDKSIWEVRICGVYAQTLLRHVYPSGCLALSRKMMTAMKILEWLPKRRNWRWLTLEYLTERRNCLGSWKAVANELHLSCAGLEQIRRRLGRL